MGEDRTTELSTLVEHFRVPPGSKVELPRGHDPGYRDDWTKERGREQLQINLAQLAEYQARLTAQETTAVLVVLQGIDAAGKDGTIRHVASGLNPQGAVVHSFKVPSAEELSHDYLWRYARRLPARGQIGIFNRSHYEEVLVVRVHPELLDPQKLPARGGDLWRRRFREINHWERYLADNGIAIVKLFLHLSKEEQRRRFLARIDQPEKNWKFSAADVREREHWDEYQRAFSEMLTHTSTVWAPWYVIPADHKWFARLAVGAVLVDTLNRIDPQYPELSGAARTELLNARVELEAEGG